MNAEQTKNDKNPLILLQESNFSVNGSHVQYGTGNIVKYDMFSVPYNFC